MLFNYLKVAWRNLNRHRTYSLINIIGLSVGMTACILIAIFIRHEMSYDQSVPESENIYRVITYWNGYEEPRINAHMPPPLAAAAMQTFEQIDQGGRILFIGDRNQVRVSTEPTEYFESGKFALADPSILNIFQIPMVYGNRGEALSRPNTVVISERVAQKYFGNANPIGSSIIVNGFEESPLEITGVMEDFPSNSHLEYDFFQSLTAFEFYPGEQDIWTNNNYFTYLKLHQGVDGDAFENTLSSVMMEKFLIPAWRDRSAAEVTAHSNNNFELQPISDIHLNSSEITDRHSRGDKKIVWLFGSISLFILIIASINFINLSTAKAANRSKEVGLRKVIGSMRRQLVQQFLTESILMTLLAFVLGFVLAHSIMPYFNVLSGKDLVFPLDDPLFLAGGVGISILVGLLAGLYPAIYLSGFDPIHVLKGKLSNGRQSSDFRSALVVFQFTTSIILIVSTLVINKQLHFILNQKIGYDKDQVIQLHGTNMIGDQEKIRSFKEELKSVQGIENVTISTYLPIEGTSRNSSGFVIEGRKDQQEPVYAQAWTVDYDYLETLGMQLVAGRNFSESRSTDAAAVIVNESLVKMLGLENPIGHHIERNNAFEIIGIVEDFNFETLQKAVDPLVMFVGYGANSIMSLKVSSQDMPTLVGQIESKWQQFAPQMEFRYTFMDDSYAAMYDDVNRTRKIFSSFSILALLVACLGLFALSAFMVDQRKKEISIRKVLGASVQSILTLVTRQFVALVVIALLIAVPVAYYLMQQWLDNYAFRTDLSVDVFFIAGISALFIAILTMSYHAFKSALLHPADNLRDN